MAAPTTTRSARSGSTAQTVQPGHGHVNRRRRQRAASGPGNMAAAPARRRGSGGNVIELVALDMAGTTIDEHGDVYLALHDGVAGEGVDVSDDLVARWMGTDKREAIANLVAEGGGDPLDADGVERGYDRFRTLLRE